MPSSKKNNGWHSNTKVKPNAFDTLHDILQEMDIPEERLNNLKWIDKNLEVLNADHPKLQEAQVCLDVLMFRNKIPTFPKKIRKRKAKNVQ